MNLKKYLPGFLIREGQADRLKEKISEAQEYLAEQMVEECELRGYVREVLEVVLERVGELQREAELLRSKIDFLRNRLNAKVEGFKQSEESWNQQEKKINDEYEQAFEKAEFRKEERGKEISKKKKPRLQRIWMKLVKLFHPDKHMDNPDDKEAYEEVMATINQAKKDGDLDKLEAIAEDPEKFLKQAKRERVNSEENGVKKKPKEGNGWFRNGEKELQKTLDSLREKIREVQKEIEDLKKSPDMSLWAIWKGRPNEFENAMREMERELTIQIETIKKTLEKLQEKLERKSREGMAA
jgi:DNA repair exonuclease SbcCD ATPase subunit